jgi:hypothetical protein
VQPANDTSPQFQRADALTAADRAVEMTGYGDWTRGTQISLGLIGQALAPLLAVHHHGLGVDIIAGQISGFEFVFKTTDRMSKFNFERLKRHQSLGRAVTAAGREQILKTCKTGKI